MIDIYIKQTYFVHSHVDKIRKNVEKIPMQAILQLICN